MIKLLFCLIFINVCQSEQLFDETAAVNQNEFSVKQELNRQLQQSLNGKCQDEQIDKQLCSLNEILYNSPPATKSELSETPHIVNNDEDYLPVQQYDSKDEMDQIDNTFGNHFQDTETESTDTNQSSENQLDKRAWKSINGSWGKRFAKSSYDTLASERATRFLQSILASKLANLAALTKLIINKHSLPAEYYDVIDQLDVIVNKFGNHRQDIGIESAGINQLDKRAWKSMSGSWGKRADNQWIKRQQHWNSLKGLWGKRTGWNKLNTTWGKRSLQ